MACAAFMQATGKAKVINVTFTLFNFLSWIACCVAFGGVLQTVQITDFGGYPYTASAYWNRWSYGDSTIYFDSQDCLVFDGQSDYCQDCTSGGKGLIATQVFAFLGLMFVMFLTFTRMLGLHIGFLEPTRKTLFLELIATASNLFWFFLSVCIYGGTCFKAMADAHGFSRTGTGYGYIIFCFFLLIANLFFIYLIRRDPSCHLGSSDGTEYTNESDPNTTNYNPPASYQYNADPSAAAYAGSYNSAIIPAQGSGVTDSNL